MDKLPLKALRAAKNLTQDEVAQLIGVNRRTYSQWENYRTYPSATQLIDLSKVFQCSLDAFYFPHNAN